MAHGYTIYIFQLKQTEKERFRLQVEHSLYSSKLRKHRKQKIFLHLYITFSCLILKASPLLPNQAFFGSYLRNYD